MEQIINNTDCDNLQVLQSTSVITSRTVNELLEHGVNVNKTDN